MSTESITLKDAQKLLLWSQKLCSPILNTLHLIEHLGYVQIDSISVVTRAHHHTLWTRNPNYLPHQIDDLMQNRKIFEHWSHAAAILPMSEYRFSLPLKKKFSGKTNSWFPKNKKMMNLVLKRIKTEGPLQSLDFKKHSNLKTSGWWDWKPAKMALERLFLEGQLEVSYRDSFRKVYDLPENVVPSQIDTRTPTDFEYYEYLIHRTLRHHGLASPKEIGYLMDKKTISAISKVLQTLVENKTIEKVKVLGIDQPYYSYSRYLNKKIEVAPHINILSPFDNFIIQRSKLKTFFDFQYQIECYVPKAKRKYGYFSLPIFKGVKPIGRVDCKADRDKKTLCIHSIHSESKSKIEKIVRQKMNSFAVFNGCDKLAW